MQSEVPNELTCNKVFEVPSYYDISTGTTKGSVAISETSLSRQVGSNKPTYASFIKA